MFSNYFGVLIILTVVAFVSVKANKLTATGAVTGWFAGLLVFAGAGYAGVAMVATFFVLGTGATSRGIHIKKKLGLAEKNKGRRTSAQVLANAGAAAILGVLAWLHPAEAELFRIMMAAALASAAADTLSSELGIIYGKNFYNIVSFKKDTRGLDGVVSLEGTLSGIAGSVAVAAVHAVFFGTDVSFLFIIIAGTVGNLSDSILGATLERRGFLGNDAVNFLNTAIAALIGMALFQIQFEN